MNPWPVEAEVEESHLPRPGHADLVGSQKYGFSDVRNVLERASARETAARVAAGALAKEFLAALGVSVHSHVLRIASVARARARRARARGLRRRRRLAGALPRRRGGGGDGRRDRPAAQGEREPRRDLRGARLRARSRARLVRRLGRSGSTAASRRRSSRSRRSRASRSARPGRSPARPGSESHDEIFWSDERGYHRETNRAGGVEGGMSNGEPLVVRGALKPISTLTKPLRSVDTETKEPAQAMRERTDSTVVPAAGRRRRGDGRAGARALLPREVRRRPHRRRSRRRARRTGSGSIGGAEHGIERAARSSSSASWARASRRPRGGRRDAGARRRSTPTSCSSAELGSSIDGVLRPRGRGGVSPPRGGGRRRAARARRRRRDRARRRQRARRAGARGARAPRRRLARRRSRRPPGSGSRGSHAAAGRATAIASTRCYAERRPLYESLADAVLPADRELVRRALPGAARAGRAAGGTRLAWARSASGEYPASTSGAGCSAGGFWPLDGRRFLRHRRDGRRALRRGARAARRRGSRSSRASRRRRWPRPSASCASSPRAGMTGPTTSPRSAAASSATSPASAPRPTSAACPIVQVPTTLVAQVDSAYGGKTGVDLPEAKNYVGAYHLPAAVLADPDAARDPAARPSSPPASSRWSRRR